MIVILILASLLFISNVYFIYKFFKLKECIHEYENIGTGRKGFYISSNNSSYKAYVYVDELDRYKDGYSKIKLSSVESLSKYISDSITMAKESFVSLKKTSEIEWLESEDAIKKSRKEKLDKLKKI